MIADLINLDDRTFADLVAEARASIPSLTPAWTDHNPSDPGVILVEMFAWLSEMLFYRLNRIPDENYWTFLKLLDPEVSRGADLESAIRSVIGALREVDRAIDESDYEYLLRTKWPRWTQSPEPPIPPLSPPLEPKEWIRRIRFLPGINRSRDGSFPDVIAPGHVSVVVLTGPSRHYEPGPTTWDPVYGLPAFLEPRRLLTSKVHVVNPRRVVVKIEATLFLYSDANPAAVAESARDAILGFVDPLSGGRDGRGWPFGQNLYVSDVYRLLANLDGVDFLGPCNVDGQPYPRVHLDAARLQPDGSPPPPPLSPSRDLPDGVDVADAELLDPELELTILQREGDQWAQV